MKNIIRFDWAIKRLLRNKANFVILEGFLSELIGDDIKIDSYLESEGNRKSPTNKTNRVDILVKNSIGELIIIEIQNDYKQDYLMRMLYATSKLITDNMDKGMDYGRIKKIISVNIVYFDLGIGDDYVYHGTTTYKGIHKNDILSLTFSEEKIYHTRQISEIYPEYYIIKVNQFNDISKDNLDEWINFFKNEVVKDDTKAKGLKEAISELNVMKLSEDELIEYENYIKDWRDTYTEMVGNYNKGVTEGEIKGKTDVVLKMSKEGISLELISKVTCFETGRINEIINTNSTL